MSQRIEINASLSVDYGLLSDEPFVAIQREQGGRVVLDISEVGALVDALQETVVRVVAEYLDKNTP